MSRTPFPISPLPSLCLCLPTNRPRGKNAVTAPNTKAGSIARVGPNDLITNSPDLLCHMSAVRSPYTRTPWYNRATRVEPDKDHLFSLTDEDTHTKRRQKMAAGYNGKENPTLEPCIDERVQQLVALLRTKYVSDPKAVAKPVDLAMKIQYFTLDVISQIGFGRAFGDLEADEDVGRYIAASEEGMRMMVFVCAMGLTPVVQWAPLARFLGPSEKDEHGHGRMMRTSRRLINDRIDAMQRGEGKGSDMMASFLQRGFSKEDIFTEAYLQILAGSDTTATAIRGLMLHVVSHPRVYRVLREEIDDAVKRGLVKDGEIISEADASTLPYLQAVIREGEQENTDMDSSLTTTNTCPVPRSTHSPPNHRRRPQDRPPRRRHPRDRRHTHLLPRRHQHRLRRPRSRAPRRPLRLRRRRVPSRALARRGPAAPGSHASDDGADFRVWEVSVPWETDCVDGDP